jgi:lysophospholipase L1-like esterase
MRVKRAILFLILIITTTAVLELIFRNYVAVTSERPTLVKMNWIIKYWSPINNMGYRDSEHSPDTLKGKKNIIVVGDSITSGFGIKDYNNRYSNLLKRKLGDEYEIINLSIPGWNTEDKANAILNYPHIKEIKVIVYQMYFDDYMPQAINYCGNPPVTPADWVLPDSGLYSIVRKSYFINYLYWRLYEITFKYRKNLERRYISYLECTRINREKILSDGFENLKAVIKLCKNNNIKLVVLKVPHLDFNDKIRENINDASKENEAVFIRNNIPVVDCINEYNKHEVVELRVNMSDCHPNEKAHRIIADALYDALHKMNL